MSVSPYPRTVLLARPLQHLQVTAPIAPSSVLARQLIPRAAVLPRPLQRLELGPGRYCSPRHCMPSNSDNF